MNIQFETINDSILLNYLQRMIDGKKVHLIDDKSMENLKKFFESRSYQEQRRFARDIIAYLLKKALEKMFGITNKFADEISRYLGEFEKYEHLLYSTEGYYRDHLAHIVRVFCLGEIILFEKDFKDFIEIREDLLEPAWCLTSLFHDLGYPIETVQTVTSPVYRMLSQIEGLNVRQHEISFDMATTTLMQRFLEELSKAGIVDMYERLEEIRESTVAPWVISRMPGISLPTLGLEIPPEREEALPWLPALGLEVPQEREVKREELKELKEKQKLSMQILELISLENAVRWEIYSQLLDGMKKHDHGVLGALILLQTCRTLITPRFRRARNIHSVIKEHDASLLQEMYKTDLLFEIAFAMAMHNLSLTLPISIKYRPLACLLSLCDTLQEWGRPMSSGLFTQPEPLLDKIELHTMKEDEVFKIQVTFDFSDKKPDVSINEFEFFKRKANDLMRITSLPDKSVNVYISCIPRKGVHKTKFEVFTCMDCGKIYPSHEEREGKIVECTHECG